MRRAFLWAVVSEHLLFVPTRVFCAAGANASRGLSRDSTRPPPPECLPPSSGTACNAEYQAWCDGSCMSADDAAAAGCETLCEANPDNGNAIECTPSLPDDQLPCFGARSPEDYPGVAFENVEHAPTVPHQAPSCCNYDMQARYLWLLHTVSVSPYATKQSSCQNVLPFRLCLYLPLG